jgi:GrpB-like predicted nucleotidyltransferase (UPF0157 family)
MRVHISTYGSRWPVEFAAAKSHIQDVLVNVPYQDIIHVGSTSIPSMPAKPVIDIDIVIASPFDLAPVRAALSAVGYTDMGEMGIPGRYQFRQTGVLASNAATGGSNDEFHAPETPLGLRRNTYVVLDGCAALRNHLAVRDLLRGDEGWRQEYAEVKLRLAEREHADMEAYSKAKSEVLGRILEASGKLSEGELKGIRKANS